MNFKVQIEVARPLLTCAKEGGDHLKDELSLLQFLGQNVTLRLWSDVKANKEREVLPRCGHDKRLIVFTSQVLRHQHHGKIHSGSIGFHQR